MSLSAENLLCDIAPVLGHEQMGRPSCAVMGAREQALRGQEMLMETQQLRPITTASQRKQC